MERLGGIDLGAHFFFQSVRRSGLAVMGVTPVEEMR